MTISIEAEKVIEEIQYIFISKLLNKVGMQEHT